MGAQLWNSQTGFKLKKTHITYILPRNFGDMRFLFLMLDAKIPKFTYVKFEKKTDIKLTNGGPQRV